MFVNPCFGGIFYRFLPHFYHDLYNILIINQFKLIRIRVGFLFCGVREKPYICKETMLFTVVR